MSSRFAGLVTTRGHLGAIAEVLVLRCGGGGSGLLVGLLSVDTEGVEVGLFGGGVGQSSLVVAGGLEDRLVEFECAGFNLGGLDAEAAEDLTETLVLGVEHLDLGVELLHVGLGVGLDDLFLGDELALAAERDVGLTGGLDLCLK